MNPPDASAPFAQQPEESRGRLYPEHEHPYRSPFQRDRDRIIHSTAFRRLEYKTQVFVNHEGDHYRTRLTHTLEVTQIARTIARALGLNEDLTEAMALAHDVGHTPFGHAGEDVLNEIMRSYGDSFEHNIHGLRVVDVLEERYPSHPGLNLTYEVREAFAKHTTRYDEPGEMPEGFEPSEMPTLEAQVVTVADEIAYDAHDVDDGIYSRLVSEDEIRSLEIYRAVAERLSERGVNLGGAMSAEIRRKQLVRGLIDLFVSALIRETSRLLVEASVSSVQDARCAGRPLVVMPAEVDKIKTPLEEFLHRRLYSHERVLGVTGRCRRFLRDMFGIYLNKPDLMPPEYLQRIQRETPHRVVCDYIAGMTDRFAQQEHARLFPESEECANGNEIL